MGQKISIKFEKQSFPRIRIVTVEINIKPENPNSWESSSK